METTVTSPPAPRAEHLWTGLEPDFHRRVMAEGQTPEGKKIRGDLESRFFYAEGKPFLLGPPVMVREGLRPELDTFAAAYHRAIETVVAASAENEEVARVLDLPEELRADLEADTHPANGRVHIFRLDLLLDDDGGFWVLETNANCPGGVLYSGEINRMWRSFIEDRGMDLPHPLEHERRDFMARWFLETAEAESGTRPDCVPLIREEGATGWSWAPSPTASATWASTPWRSIPGSSAATAAGLRCARVGPSATPT